MDTSASFLPSSTGASIATSGVSIRRVVIGKPRVISYASNIECAECDPANPKYASGDFLACGKGFQCQPVPPNTLDVVPGQTMCMYWSDQPRLGAGQACTYDNDCDPGFACRPITLTPPDDGGIMVVCRRWCHVGDNSCGSSACEPTGLFAGDVELGLCLPW